jgi:hypothetical protein
MVKQLLPFSWERLIGIVEKVRERLLRSTSALEAAGVPYAVIGGNAVAAWVSRVDEEATRNTKDVDILIRRNDLPDATAVLERHGFVHAEVLGVPMFLDGPDGKPSVAVHVIIAGEKVRPEYLAPAPDVDESEKMADYRAVSLEALVRMKLTSFRFKDRTHILDLIGVGLVDAAWPAKFQPELGARLQELLDNPDG